MPKTDVFPFFFTLSFGKALNLMKPYSSITYVSKELAAFLKIQKLFLGSEIAGYLTCVIEKGEFRVIASFNKCQLLNCVPSSLPSLSSPFLSAAKVLVWLLSSSSSFSLPSPKTSLASLLLCQITVTRGQSPMAR